MANLSDFFSDELKQENANNNLKIGAVIIRHETLTTPPKIKRSIIVGFSRDKAILASIFINSEINPNLFPTEESKELHLELNAIDRPYLTHTSYADCSRLHEHSIEDIKSSMVSNPASHLGELCESDLFKILGKIKSAKTISVRKKKEYGWL